MSRRSPLRPLPTRPALALAFSLALTLLGASCASPKKVAFQNQESAARQVLDTDRAFAALSEREGPAAAYRRFASAETRSLGAAGDPLQGGAQIAERLSKVPGMLMRWSPQGAEAAQSGDLGWSWGTYESSATGPRGGTQLTQGKYVSIWHRQADGSWKLALELGNEAAQR
jgi:ketosteroid isomerase-like protein